jgi:hypothetical protein
LELELDPDFELDSELELDPDLEPDPVLPLDPPKPPFPPSPLLPRAPDELPPPLEPLLLGSCTQIPLLQSSPVGQLPVYWQEIGRHWPCSHSWLAGQPPAQLAAPPVLPVPEVVGAPEVPLPLPPHAGKATQQRATRAGNLTGPLSGLRSGTTS